MLGYVIALSVLDVLGITFNLIVIITIYQSKNLHTVNTLFILNLCIVDLMVAVFILPSWIVNAHAQRLIYPQELCVIIGMLTVLHFLETISTLASIAVDRFLGTFYAVRYPLMMTNTRAAIIIAYTWCQATVLSCLPLAGFSKYGFRHFQLPVCNINYMHTDSYPILLLATTVFPSSLTIAFCYIRIVVGGKIRTQRVRDLLEEESHVTSSKQKRPVTKANGRDPTVAIEHKVDRASGMEAEIPMTSRKVSPAPGKTRRCLEVATSMHRMDTAERLWNRAAKAVRKSMVQLRASRTVATIIVVFVVCWSPYIGLIIHSVHTDQAPSANTEFITSFLALANSVANPLICFIVNREFRRSTLLTIGCRRRKLMRRVASTILSPMVTPVHGNARSRRGTRTSSMVSNVTDVATVEKLYAAFVEDPMSS